MGFDILEMHLVVVIKILNLVKRNVKIVGL